MYLQITKKRIEDLTEKYNTHQCRSSSIKNTSLQDMATSHEVEDSTSRDKRTGYNEDENDAIQEIFKEQIKACQHRIKEVQAILNAHPETEPILKFYNHKKITLSEIRAVLHARSDAKAKLKGYTPIQIYNKIMMIIQEENEIPE